MITCPHCQFENPGVHKFCQQCGEPLPAEKQSSKKLEEKPGEEKPRLANQQLQVCLMPPDRRLLSPATYINGATVDDAIEGATEGASRRYKVATVLSEGRALLTDEMPEVRSPLQAQLAQLYAEPLCDLNAILNTAENLPAAAYPYLMLADTAPLLYDVLQQGDTTLLISHEEADILPLLTALSQAVDALQPVYWIYTLTELWEKLKPIPQWRSSLIQADNIGVDIDQSLRVRRFSEPSIQPPALADLKGFIESLLAQSIRAPNPLLPQIRDMLQAIATTQTIEDVKSELTAIGESLLDAPLDTLKSDISKSDISKSETSKVEALKVDVSKIDVSKIDVSKTTASDDISGASPITEPDSSATVETVATDDSSESVQEMTTDNSEDLLNKALPADGEFANTDDETLLLPMRLSSLAEAGRTDVGKQRDHNEDCFLIDSSLYKRADNNHQYIKAHGLYVLCDGMGGHEGGEIASSLAAKTLSNFFDKHWPVPAPAQPEPPLPDESTVVAAVKLANQAIYDVNEQEERAGHKRMGTTLVMVLLQGTEAVVAHVGDSRLYQYNQRIGLQQVTVDHEVGQREMQRGIPEGLAYARPDAYQLTQALGPRDSDHLKPSVTYLRFIENTLLLLCSDGLSDNNLVEDYLESHINPLLTDNKELSSGLNDLVSLANEVNGHDNISVIALQIKVTPDIGRKVKPQNAGQTVLQ